MSDPERRGDLPAAGPVAPSAPSSVAVVRRYAVDASVALGWGDFADTVALLTTEVATNAILHAQGHDIGIRVADHDTRLRIEVFDGSPVLPVPRRTPASAEDGRGLALVQALALRWGVDARRDGKTFWFEIGP